MRLRCLTVLSLAIAPAAAQAAELPTLAGASSEFVRAQSASPIRWQPWNDTTLTRARESGRSIYVFVGSPLSELSRATISQTFVNEKTVAWLNENFFCIFVDADTQPEVAAYARHFLDRVKQLRGWPAHLWFTSDLQPYDGSNYLPPSEEWGKPGFLKASRAALDSWTPDPARARALAAEAFSMMRLTPLGAAPPLELKPTLERAAVGWLATADPRHGGFGSAPKDPEPELIRFLLARDGAARAAALKTLRALVTGAAHDPVDGGFYRRTIDEAWQEPHRQKTLSDQARIALALLDAADIAKDDPLRAAAFGALDFALKDLRNPDGSFAAALDGTLEENADPAKRPNFVRVGRATTGTQGMLITALQRTGEKRFTATAAQLAGKLREQLSASGDALEHIAGVSPFATAADYAAVALGFRSLKDDATAERLLSRANRTFFDTATGNYLSTSAKLPLGIALRVPASGDTPSAEALALMAGVDAGPVGLIRRAMLSDIEHDETPAGDALLALSLVR